ncbi:MAG: B12-binding domain-containing radical SAM protein, partial [Anaerolineae bacterium]|nr:B12-binding domain-containing radical SAM protein [Anaerolineae bacterium]
VIICGSDASDHAPAYLEKGADYVIRGEGEQTLQELMAFLTGKSSLSPQDILGLAFYDSSKKLVMTPPRQVMKNLDEMPFPAWDLVDVPRYKKLWQEQHGYYSVNMVTTRGCPYKCNWCAKPIWGQRYNVRSPQNVVAEMKWLKENLNPDHLWFADDILGLKPGWIQEFAALIKQQQIKIPFKCLSRADLLLVDDTIEAMKQAGADIIWMGAESGSQKILDAMDKGTTVEQIYEATRKLKKTGIRVGFFLQFGYPGENREDIQKTIQMVRDLMPDDIGISVSYPLPGTKFYESVKTDLTVTNWQDSADLAMLFKGPYPTEFYRQLHTVIHKDYRSRKTWQAVKRGALKPWKRSDVRQVAAMIYHRLTLPAAQARLNRLAQMPHRPTQMIITEHPS